MSAEVDADDPDRFFEKREGLVAPLLAHAVQGDSCIRRGVDGKLYRYRRGVYLNDGREFVRARARTARREIQASL